MPDGNAENGDVYQVYRKATTDPTKAGAKTDRPMACVAARKDDPVAWTALPRTTTDGRPQAGDLFSPAQPGIGLDKDGHWTLRWIHGVLKAKTGSPACEYLGTLAEPERRQVLSLYRNRHK